MIRLVAKEAELTSTGVSEAPAKAHSALSTLKSHLDQLAVIDSLSAVL